MMTVYASVDGTPVILTDRMFVDTRVHLVFQPTYGRVLFAQHDTMIERNIFVRSTLDIGVNARGVVVQHNRFEGAA